MYQTTSQQILKRYEKLRQFKSIQDEEKLLPLITCMYKLTPKWFEEYIGEYFRKIGKYTTIDVRGWKNDKWFDIVCKRGNEYAVIQCKKYETTHTRLEQILKFNYDIEKNIPKEYQLVTNKYFVTTNRCNKDAKNYAKEKDIYIRDLHKIIKINKDFPIDEFIIRNQWKLDIITDININEVLNDNYNKQFSNAH